jgi:hypothetical protein
MSVEYLFAASVTIADRAAPKKGWRPTGRAAWLNADALRFASSVSSNSLRQCPPA